RLCKEYYSANATILSPETLKEICNSCRKVKNAVTVMAKKHHIITKRVYEIWHKHNSDDNQKSSYDDTSSSSSSIQMQADKKKSKSKSIRIPDNKDLSKKVDSENTLEVFKKAQNGIEKAVAKGCALEQKLKT
ncbi:8094_t:CDS:2, partial [Funneliformis geosporum]